MPLVSSAFGGGAGTDTLLGGTRTLGGTAAQRGLSRVDPRLVEIIDAAAERSPYDVQIMSGIRPGDPRQHGRGNAIDVVLIDPTTGERIPNYKSKAAYPIYEGFARIAREEQMRLYPDLADTFRWGGGFRQGVDFDLMHFDVNSGMGMAYYNWETGINEAGRKALANLGDGKIYADGEVTKAPKGMKYANLWGRDPLIARTPIALSPLDRDIAIRTVIGEAIGEGEEGMAAAAHVIANRYDQGFGPSVAAIASDASQFDAWNRDLVTAYAPGSPEYEKAGQIVDEVFGKAKGVRPPDPTEGATFFYSGDKKPGFWSRGVEEVKRIGGHVFGVAKGAFKPQGFTLRQTKSTTPDPRTAMLQQQLTRAGLYKGQIDGRYGPQTKAAVRAWQDKNGMRPTGIADVPTLQSLKLPTSEARFQRALLVNPETPGNRAKLFPEDQPISPQEQVIEEVLGTNIFGSKGQDFTAPLIARDRLGTDRLSGASGQDRMIAGKTTTDRLRPPAETTVAGRPDVPVGKLPASARRDAPPTPRPSPRRPAAASAAAPAGAGLQHRVRPGDTFGKLAKQYLGDAARWKEIEAANPGINARSIQIGTPLNIPGVSGPPSPRSRPDPNDPTLTGNRGSEGRGPDLRGEIRDQVTFDILEGGDKTGRPAHRVAPASPPITEDDVALYGRAVDANFRRKAFDFDTGGPLRPGAEPPPARPVPPEARAKDDAYVPAQRPAIDVSAAADAAKKVAGLPRDMNVSGAEAWGERYEEDPTLLTDLGLFDRRPMSGRSPAELSLDAMPSRDTGTRSLPGAGGQYRSALAPQRLPQNSTRRPVTPVLRQDSGLPDQPDYIEFLFGPREVPATGTVAVSETKVPVEAAPTQQTGGEYMTDTRPPRNDALASELNARRRQMETMTRPPAVITDRSAPRAEARPTSLSLDAMPGSDTAVQPPQDARDPLAAFDEVFGVGSAQALPFAEVESTSRFNAKATGGKVPTRTVEAYDDEDLPGDVVQASDEIEAPADPVAALAAVQNAPAVVKARREAGAYPGAVRTDQGASYLPTSRAAGAQAGGTTSQLPQSRAVYGYQATAGGVNPAGIAYTTGTANGRPAIQTANWTAVQNPDGTYSHGYQ